MQISNADIKLCIESTKENTPINKHEILNILLLDIYHI